MEHLRDARIPIYLRPIELALLLTHARRMEGRAFAVTDPLEPTTHLETQAWRSIGDAVLDTLKPTAKPATEERSGY